MKTQSLTKFWHLLSAIAIAFAVVILPVHTAQAASNVVITENEIARQPENTPPTKNWVLYTRNAGSGYFRTGPATPPAGIGSLEFATPTGSDKAFLFNYDYIGTKLSNIDTFGYATNRTAGDLQQVT